MRTARLLSLGARWLVIGSGGMPQTPTVGQGWVQQNVTVKAQDRVKVTDSNDAEVVSLTAEQAATSLFVSTPQVMEGQTYKGG